MYLYKPKDYFVFNKTIRGASHIKKDIVCQDYSDSSLGNKYMFTVLADGHGSEKYFRSDRGAKLACEVSKESIHLFMKDIFKSENEKDFKENQESFLKQLEQNIYYNWRKAVEKDIQAQPLTDEEEKLIENKDIPFKAYGCTLLINVVCLNKFWFGIHIGDGKCVVLSESFEFSQPIPWDDQCFLNVTTSLCDGNALDNFRHFISFDDIPLALFIGSDGIDDSFSDDHQLHDLYQQVLNTFSEKGPSEGEKEVVSFLPVLSKKGSGDDVSIAGIIHKKARRG